MSGLRHVRGVRPNRAADFTAAILDPKIPYKLTFILPLIAMLTTQSPLGELTAKGGQERGGERKGRRGAGRGEGGEVDSDVQLEQGRRLAKAGLVVK